MTMTSDSTAAGRIAGPARDPRLVSPGLLPSPTPRRKLLWPHQTLPPCQHPLRKTRRQLSRLRSTRRRGRLAQFQVLKTRPRIPTAPDKTMACHSVGRCRQPKPPAAAGTSPTAIVAAMRSPRFAGRRSSRIPRSPCIQLSRAATFLRELGLGRAEERWMEVRGIRCAKVYRRCRWQRFAGAFGLHARDTIVNFS